MEQIHIRISESDKTRWQDAVEESNEYNNLTHLITASVDSELADDNHEQMLDIELDPVEAKLDALLDKINQNTKQLREVEAKVDNDKDVLDIASDLLDLLPRADSTEEFDIKKDRKYEYGTEDAIRRAGRESDVEEYYSRKGHTKLKAKIALEKLTVEMDQATGIVDEDDIYYVITA